MIGVAAEFRRTGKDYKVFFYEKKSHRVYYLSVYMRVMHINSQKSVSKLICGLGARMTDL